ncbi:MAG: T9SS type A sorting domain-containing protein, partial [candidate division KSB1 bacterium]|nr:T9SS type A sorting domain-containing protein [candidate division KSB1 bacterium]
DAAGNLSLSGDQSFTTAEQPPGFEVPALLPPPPSGQYYAMGDQKVILTSEADWEFDNGGPHGLQVIEANRDGYRYWGYYWVADYTYFGLARSNDLVNWDKYRDASGTPIPILVRSNIDWPTVGIDNGIIYMIHVENFGEGNPLVLESSSDGIHFSFVKTIVPGASQQRNWDPRLFQNPNDGKWYLYWYHRQGGVDYIFCRVANRIVDLDKSSNIAVLSRPYLIASPSMLYANGLYYLTVESLNGSIWIERAYYSTSPTGGFVECTNSPILDNDVACGMQHAFEGKLYFYVCKRLGSTALWAWEQGEVRLIGKKMLAKPTPEQWTEQDLKEPLPTSFSLEQNYPNPFNAETKIMYQLPQQCHVRLTVYDLLGQKLKNLIDEEQEVGTYEVSWDGRDEQGNFLASGLYLYLIEAGRFRSSKKLLLLK